MDNDLWVGIFFSLGGGAVLALIVVSSDIPKWSVYALVVLGSAFFSISWYLLGWGRSSPVKLVLLHGITWLLMGLLGAKVFPKENEIPTEATGAVIASGVGDLTANGVWIEANTKPLTKLSDKYSIVGAVVAHDPAVDPYENEHIAIGNPFKITGEVIRMQISFVGTKVQMHLTGGQIKVFYFLFPKGKPEPREVINRLSDIPKYKGILLDK